MEDAEWGETPSVRGTNVGILSFSRKQGGKSSVRCGLFPPGFRMVSGLRACGNKFPHVWKFTCVPVEFRPCHNEIPASYFQKFGAYEIN